jgi:hypothetical protein
VDLVIYFWTSGRKWNMEEEVLTMSYTNYLMNQILLDL